MEIVHRNTDYALRALAALAGGGARSAAALAEETAVPLPFMRKVLRSLARAGLLEVHRGPGGGFRLARPAEGITLRAVMEAIQGPVVVNRCLLGRDRCARADTCPLRAAWEEPQRQLVRLFDELTLARLLPQLPA